MKNVDLVYAPLGDNRLLELHLTRNQDQLNDSELKRAFELILSSIQFIRE